MLHCQAAIYLKELPPFLITTYKAVNSGGGFPGVSNSAFSLEVAFQVFILLTSLTAASSSIMRGYCGPWLFGRPQFTTDGSGQAYRPDEASRCRFQKVSGATTLHRSLYSSDVMHEPLHSFNLQLFCDNCLTFFRKAL